MLSRSVASSVKDALADTPVVVIQGARQVGKSTLAGMVSAGRARHIVTLDDELARAAAAEDPVGFLRQAGDGLLVIDEAQRSPELILPLKAEVDHDRRPGRFLLTGSADLLRVKGVGDSLAGRAETIELLPLSQGEIAGRTNPEDVVAWILDGAPTPARVPLEPGVVLRGGYPEPLARTERRASAWFANYAQRLADHDARDLLAVEALEEIAD